MARGLKRFLFVAACLAFSVCVPAFGQIRADQIGSPYLDTPVFEVLEHFRKQGYPFAYSTNLVPDTLTVRLEPVSSDPIGIVREILRPHGLVLKQSDGIYLVIREARGPPGEETGSVLIISRDQSLNLINLPVVISGNPGLPAAEDLGPGVRQIKRIPAGSHELLISAEGYIAVRRTVNLSAGDTVTLNIKLDMAPAELETLNVSTSRYVLFSNSQFFVDQRAIQNLPGNGDDPLRTLHRLPGAAAGGWSARTHFRGGEENESAIFLNGLRLLDPFHVRDFHNVFSSIDSRTISGVEAYTGGFPASYGDRMSGLMLLQSSRPDKPRRHELGISVFNTSLLTSGYNRSGKIDWLFSARRSNLDLVLDRKEHGNPKYNDMFGTLGVNFSTDTRLTFNFLRASDKVLVITEHLPEDREQSFSDTTNQHFWFEVEHEISPEFSSSMVVSSSSFRNMRNATVGDIEQLAGFVRDDREVDVHGLRGDFSWYANNDHILTWGFEARKESARYHYRSEVGYDGFYLAYPGVPESLSRDISVFPSGESYAAYVSDRWQLTPQLVIDSGLRWDKQTYIGPVHDNQVSPRFNMLYSLSPRIDLRLTWGRYHQSQQIQQLQVEDGVDRFFRSQQAEHLIAGASLRLGPDWSLRIEAFEKQYSDLRPRYENLLDPVPLIAELEPDRIMVAPSSGRSRGAEFTVQYDASETLNGWASYTLSRVTDRIDGSDQARNWDQRHSLQAGLAWKKNQWEFGLAARFRSGWPTTSATVVRDEDDELMLVYGPRNAENLGSFANIDLRVTRSWQLEKSRLTAFFEVSNMLDHRNECCVDYDVEEEDEEPLVLERSVNHWLGASPAIGILWEF
jgi:outer membrane receptor protein involved in Fe transport